MAMTEYAPDPYNGWSNINPASNYPASRIMTDTSGQWVCTGNYGFLRTYEERSQGCYDIG